MQCDGAQGFPRLDDAETFDRIIASDVIYQKEDVKPIVVSVLNEWVVVSNVSRDRVIKFMCGSCLH